MAGAIATEAALQKQAQDMLEGPEFFTCQRTHTTMRKCRCIERQHRGIKIAGGYLVDGFVIRRVIPFECQNCPQGKLILAEEQARKTEKVPVKKIRTKKKQPPCLVLGCTDPQHGKGRCKRHYNMAYRARREQMRRLGLTGPAVVEDLRDI